MFVDVARIFVKAGKGGNGSVSFHREKYVPAGGPDGGDGGKGGNIVIKVDNNMSTLMDFRYKKKYVAQNGQDGAGKKCFGKDGEDIVIKVPLGTIVRDADSNAIMHDMIDEEPFVVARGGNGGWGNTHFATATRQAPRFAKNGMPGEEKTIILEMKMIADVGLIGFPNVGKSTLLSVISAARPKVANYHFTTLQPNLGVVFIGEGSSFVVADIPGLIEGASEGAGLGHDFLRHIERCRLLVHLVDASGSEGRDPINDITTINLELASFNQDLASRKQIIVANKTDILQDPSVLETIKRYASEHDFGYAEISAATHSGVNDLLNLIWEELKTLPPIRTYEPEYIESDKGRTLDKTIHITKEDNVYYVTGEWIKYMIESTNFNDYESKRFLEKQLRESGLYDMLVQEGIRDGDTVSIYEMEFDYVD